MVTKTGLVMPVLVLAGAMLDYSGQALAAGAVDATTQGAGPHSGDDALQADPEAVAKLIGLITTAIDGFGAEAAQQDIEAAIVFAIDQAHQSPAVERDALAHLETVPQNSAAKSRAIANVARSRRRGRGTQALTDRSAIFGPGGGPSVVVGGGGSNYSN